MENVRRRRLLFSLATSAGFGAAAQSSPASSAHEGSRVVFVCEHGSVKSLIAASYFNRSATALGLPYRAVARGTAPERNVPAPVRQGLRAVGIDVSEYVPQLFRGSDVEGAALVVSFDQDITGTVGNRAPHWTWDNLPGVLADYARGRDAIIKHVDALIDRLAHGDSL